MPFIVMGYSSPSQTSTDVACVLRIASVTIAHLSVYKQ